MYERGEGVSDDLLVERDGTVAVVRLNRPQVGNAMTMELFAELQAVCDGLDADDSVRAIVITGSGAMFCAGTDLSAGGATWSDQTGWDGFVELDLRKLNTPVLAAVNGAAVGAGIAIATMCDIRVVAEDAKLGFVFPRRGMIADNDLHWWLPRLIGAGPAMELLMTGRIFSGAEAGQLGLATRVVPRDDVLSATMEIAADLATNCSPLSVAATKALTYRMLREPSLARAHEIEWAMFRRFGERPDAAEGAASFLERRAPQWTSVASELADLMPPAES
jgi:enoyl-CoA hydratase/carnithine racemase